MNPTQDVSLPGVHSALGGGYLPRARERLLLIEPRRISVRMIRPVESSEDKVLGQALAGAEVRLDAEQERLLRSRYIHQSAHWAPSGILLVNKPAPGNKRNVYPDHPQKGYPQ
jgi:hypothetical protein